MSSYSPYFDYTIKPATDEDPSAHCYKTEPYDMTKCDYGITGQKKSAFVSPNNMNMYHDGPAISYYEGKGFPTALSEDTAYFPVQDLTNNNSTLRILDNGQLNCKKPSFNDNGPINSYNPCKSTEIKCCQKGAPTCSFDKCKQPDHRFGMAESIYRQDPENYKKYQSHNRWKNLSSKDFIESGDYQYVTKQQWTSSPWSLERYATPKECPSDHHEEWRTDADRCHSDYKICHNVFNNMTRRKCIL